MGTVTPPSPSALLGWGPANLIGEVCHFSSYRLLAGRISVSGRSIPLLRPPLCPPERRCQVLRPAFHRPLLGAGAVSPPGPGPAPSLASWRPVTRSPSAARSCSRVARAEPAETGPFCLLQEPELFSRDHRTELRVTQPKGVHRKKTLPVTLGPQVPPARPMGPQDLDRLSLKQEGFQKEGPVV